MDLVSFESPQEYRHFATMMYYGNQLFHQFSTKTKKWKYFNPKHNSFLYRQHQFHPHIWAEVQFPKQGLRCPPPSTDQHQRVRSLTRSSRWVCSTSQVVLGWWQQEDPTDQPTQQTHLLEQVSRDFMWHTSIAHTHTFTHRGDLVKDLYMKHRYNTLV